MNNWEKIKQNIGIIILIAAFGLALVRVFTLQSSEVIGNKKIIRLVHWQLETGVREAVDEIGRQYSELHPDVEIKQIIIGERGYGSWFLTRLLGGTAPDLIQIGMIDWSLAERILISYFVPFSSEVLKPNPYNKGTILEGVPWKDTYYDNMNSSFSQSLLDYYSVGSSAVTVRMFYNKKLFKEATGMDAPPSDFREFIKACEQIKEYGKKNNKTLVPIAGAGKYNTEIIFNRFEYTVNTTLLDDLDISYDGNSGPEDTAIGLVGGKISFHDPRIKAMFKGREAYIPQFQPAFFPADRMDAAFLFIQQKAVMIASGLWDALSYRKQSDFEIGICDFPLPSKDDPEFGKFIKGPVFETIAGGFAFSLCRYSKHPDIALDFMKFMTSQKMNDFLCKSISWIPMIKGNIPDKSIEEFWPHFDGVKSGIWLKIGSQNEIRLNELLNLFSTGRITFDEFMDKFQENFLVNTDTYMKMDQLRNNQISFNNKEFKLAIEHSRSWLTDNRQEKITNMIENLISNRFAFTEFYKEYEKARKNTKLKTKT